jgi:hypothetical protein
MTEMFEYPKSTFDQAVFKDRIQLSISQEATSNERNHTKGITEVCAELGLEREIPSDDAGQLQECGQVLQTNCEERGNSRREASRNGV